MQVDVLGVRRSAAARATVSIAADVTSDPDAASNARSASRTDEPPQQTSRRPPAAERGLAPRVSAKLESCLRTSPRPPGHVTAWSLERPAPRSATHTQLQAYSLTDEPSVLCALGWSGGTPSRQVVGRAPSSRAREGLGSRPATSNLAMAQRRPAATTRWHDFAAGAGARNAEPRSHSDDQFQGVCRIARFLALGRAPASRSAGRGFISPMEHRSDVERVPANATCLREWG